MFDVRYRHRRRLSIALQGTESCLLGGTDGARQPTFKQQENLNQPEQQMQENPQPLRGEPSRPSGGMRWLTIVVRTSHIGVAAVFFGGCVLHVPFAQLGPWHHLTIATGGGLLILEWLHDPHWPHRGKGLLAILHVCLGVIIHLKTGLTVPLLWGALVSGCIGSHMSRRFRHWSVLYGKELKEERGKRP